MNAAILLISAGCLIGADGPSLGDGPAPVVQGSAAGEPVAAPAASGPTQSWQPAPRRRGWLTGFFRRKTEAAQPVSPTTMSAAPNGGQPAARPRRRLFGRLRGNAPAGQTVPANGGYISAGSGPQIMTETAEPPLAAPDNPRP
jgi:hypothetical protein